ncbi:hypothetical protein, partial [Secundilactobacillus kimchicus]|uniref:hypothetical protein n=1 Tax=Secundilactobacillus kimchicus TaxID=528209 RepID=UPI001C00CED6
MMTKQKMLKLYAGGFVTGNGILEDNLLLDKDKTNGKELYLQAYDANLWPAPDFEVWSPKAKIQTIKELSEQLGDIDFDVYLDELLVIEKGVVVND